MSYGTQSEGVAILIVIFLVWVICVLNTGVILVNGSGFLGEKDTLSVIGAVAGGVILGSIWYFDRDIKA